MPRRSQSAKKVVIVGAHEPVSQRWAMLLGAQKAAEAGARPLGSPQVAQQVRGEELVIHGSPVREFLLVNTSVYGHDVHGMHVPVAHQTQIRAGRELIAWNERGISCSCAALDVPGRSLPARLLRSQFRFREERRHGRRYVLVGRSARRADGDRRRRDVRFGDGEAPTCVTERQTEIDVAAARQLGLDVDEELAWLAREQRVPVYLGDCSEQEPSADTFMSLSFRAGPDPAP